ncbi:hypothetical protein TK0398 [Thermococcus kodakarensis KOD1]|uniref:Uncharacterized protein n=1 Tax=Thermococcus kodakarensis (strain ATCC BAA-918 / JCM 12380 / KOD1) TaxID=69014 RepID=Q5JG87_THEKO|nr:hypothetical protein [Thermococcus kodakarensis]WCN28469.1 hypothetical protein POG15_02035 [Thermococcus kodakarensis]WCN30765.1 hypothetical protein POG21_02035 [Thermococcus kodakarensis]BAD84587.1 hypothetical protein TK0398 [Thermococcus kodakarensis KOD1]
MRRKALVLSLVVIFLAAFISGCINNGEPKTVTVTKTVRPEKESNAPATTSASPNTASQFTQTTSSQKTPKINCNDDSWRDNFSQALTCALDPKINHNFDPVYSLSLTGNKTKDALIITDFLVNYVHLDEFVENLSMKKGHYYNIKTPYELFQTRQGTYADMALFGAYALAKNGFETYLFEIATTNGFGVLPGFKLIVNHPWVPNNDPLVIFWPFRIPMRLSAALKLLNLSGETPKNVTVYTVSYNSGKYKVEKVGTYPASEFKFNIMEWVLFGFPDSETMNRLLSRDFPGCKYTTNLSAISSNQEDVKNIKVVFPYGILFYNVPFKQRYTEILYTLMISNQEIAKDLQNCRVLLLGPETDFDFNNPPANYTATYSGWVSR